MLYDWECVRVGALTMGWVRAEAGRSMSMAKLKNYTHKAGQTSKANPIQPLLGLLFHFYLNFLFIVCVKT